MSKSRVIDKLGSFPDKEPYKFPFGKCVKAEKKGYFDTCLFRFLLRTFIFDHFDY